MTLSPAELTESNADSRGVPSRMLGYLLSGSEAQRSAVADELDNDLIQVAASLDVRMGILARTVALSDDPALIESVAVVRESVTALRGGLRRAVLLLGAANASDGDLESAMQDLGARAAIGANLSYTVIMDTNGPVPSTAAGVLYRVAQEAVSSALSSPDVTSIEIAVSATPDDWMIRVTSDGATPGCEAQTNPLTRSLERLSEYIDGMDGSVVARDDATGQRVVEALVPISPGGTAAWLNLAADAQLVFDALSLGLVVVGRSWRVLFANVAAARLLGRTPQQIEGELLWTLAEDFASPEFRDLLLGAMAGQYEGSIESSGRLPIARVWFNPSPFGTLLQFDGKLEYAESLTPQ
jgi:PAS domain-containing protein